MVPDIREIEDELEQEEIDLEHSGITGDGRYWLMDKPGTWHGGRAIYKRLNYEDLKFEALVRGIKDFPEQMELFRERATVNEGYHSVVLGDLEFRIYEKGRSDRD